MSSPPTCDHCETASPALKLCGSCKRVSYCNKTCQQAAWKWHKAACRSMVQPGDMIQTTHVIKDPSKPRMFPTVDELMDKAEREGKMYTIPLGVTTEKRLPGGGFVVLIDEDRWQEKQLEEAARKAFVGGQKNAGETEESCEKSEVVGKGEKGELGKGSGKDE